jgi:8-oxo-dGTP diphosphatase
VNVSNADVRCFTVVAAVIRRGSAVLLVEQPVGSNQIGWSLPGGVVEATEDALSAVVREVREETGLRVSQVLGMAYVVQYVRHSEPDRTTALVFEVHADGHIHVDDPSDEVIRAEFFPLEVATAKLAQFPIKVMVEPAVAYLSGTVAPGDLWIYEERGGETHLLSRTPTVQPVVEGREEGRQQG